MRALTPAQIARTIVAGGAAGLLAACGHGQPAVANRGPLPSILLVTLDTTRADAMGPDARGITTPAFNALAARGRRFTQAYAAVPETFPSHATMLSGRYPAGHGVHENARVLDPSTPLAAEALHAAGYRTTAFVSSFVLNRRFGLGRGFDVYDDAFGAGRAERPASETLAAALGDLNAAAGQPRFMWVHFNDPHAPYAPPEPFRSQYAKAPYLGEVAAMDAALGTLVAAFEQHAGGPVAIVVAADHGEGLGDHGESEHGHLLYQSTMHVPLVVVAPGLAAGIVDTPVSTRSIYETLLKLAGAPIVERAPSIADHRSPMSLPIDLLQSPMPSAPVVGEAMKPFLEYGWQPQVMSVSGRYKAILSGRIEGFDVLADPAEAHDLAGGPTLPEAVRNAAYDYPVPLPGGGAPAALTSAEQQQLASLGYVSGGPAPVIRKDAPRAADMIAVVSLLVRASNTFSAGNYPAAIPLFEQILTRDPKNVAAVLELAASHSALGHRAEADRLFDRAHTLAPASADVAYYRALHDARYAMGAGETAAAIAAFERARGIRPSGFQNDLELGVLYLASRRFTDARDALDRVLPSSPGYPMALFKRAQVAVLLNEPDAARRVEFAREHADPLTRRLIESERLFQGK